MCEIGALTPAVRPAPPLAPTNALCRTCDSTFVCDCVEQPQFADWYALDCAFASNSSAFNTTAAKNASSPSIVTLESDMFENVSALSILVAIVTGAAMLALIALSVLFARYRKRSKIVVQLEGGMEAVKNKLEASKAFSKEFFARHNLPSARYRVGSYCPAFPTCKRAVPSECLTRHANTRHSRTAQRRKPTSPPLTTQWW